MCNEAARRVSVDQIHDAFREFRIPLLFPEGLPNLAALDSIRITDPTVIVRAASSGANTAELVQRRWSWPGPTGKPVFNYRGEGREFANTEHSGRCLIVADGFYEYTAPEHGAKRKTRWLFTRPGEDFFCIAGLWRTDPKVGEACTMLTVEPGPDIAPYHNRQVVVLERADWGHWLGGAVPARELLRSSTAGSFEVRPA